MVDERSATVLQERLEVWKGPLPIDIVGQPRTFLDWIRNEFGDVTDVIVDSLKDIALDLIKDETGSRVNNAFQHLIADNWIELVVSHHQRKQQSGGAQPKALADVYGSRWLTAGMGSVALLWGEPGDLVVDFRHLKQPVEEVGPFKVQHDHVTGTSSVFEQVNLETALRSATHGLLVRDAASLMFEKDDPTPNEVEKARRKLNKLVAKKRAERRDDADGSGPVLRM